MKHQHQMLEDDFDMEQDATRVQPSPFAYGGTQIAYGAVLASLPDESGVVQHQYSEPARGYPPYAAYVPPVEIGEYSPGPAAYEEPYVEHAEPWSPPAASQVRDISVLPAHQVWPGRERAVVPHGSEPLVPPQREDETTVFERAAQQAEASAYVAASAATPYVAPPPPPLPASPLSPYYVAVTPAARAAASAAQSEQTVSAPAFAPSAAPSFATPPQETVTPAPASSEEKRVRTGRAIWGGLLGAIAGAGLWGGIGFLTGGMEIKYAAIVLGMLTGLLAARLAGGTSKGVGIIAAVLSVFGLVAGKALFELLVQPGLTMAGHIAYHTTPIDLIFFGATLVTGFAVGAGLASPRSLLRRRPTISVGVPGVPSV